ncbi:MAG TPA: enoyl-CoA hydratase/isomerase family protein [Desulfomonilia bacterium]|nr:enoyl-CoA hydratase/isomerase family protein [Desulfomonilia bacterium]
MLNERIEDGIIIATFEHGKTNPLTLEILRQLRVIVKKANQDDAVKGIILTGAGRSFSSGFDLPMFMGFKDINAIGGFFDEVELILVELFECRKPVVSAMNGHTIAGGLIFAMATDYRIVKNHPKISIGMSEIKLGLALTIAQSEIMQFGYESSRKFRDLMYFGKMLDVNGAREYGLVDEVVEDADLIPRAKEVIKKWIDNPGRAFIKLKEGLKKPTADRIRKRLAEEDWKEGFKCFFDKDVRTSIEFVMSMM